MKTNQTRAPKGTVSILDKNGMLQLRWRYQGKRFYLSLGIPTSKANLVAAQAKVKVIESDIAYERLDQTLTRYKPAPISAPKELIEESGNTVTRLELWQRYTQFKASQLNPSTIARDYAKVEKRLQRLPSEPENGVLVRDWLLRHYSAETTRRTLVQLNACYTWAMRSAIVDVNPYSGLSQDIRSKRNSSTPESFSAQERDAIIAAFESDRYCPAASQFKHSYYAGYVKFLFYVGARPEEAQALQWKDISPDFSLIRITSALPSDTKLRGRTKTGKARAFPCNDGLRSLLKSIKSEGAKPLDLVFPGPRGSVLDSHNFCNRVWRPVLEGLVKDGLVHRYLSPYHCRHTWHSLLSKAGVPAEDIAALGGNSPEIVYRRYVSPSRELKVPEV